MTKTMGNPERLALLALIRGLRRARTIHDDAIDMIAEELAGAAGSLTRPWQDGSIGATLDFLSLADQVRRIRLEP